MKYSCGSGGLDRPRLQPRPDVGEADASRRCAGLLGRGVVPRSGPATEGGLVDGVDRRLHVGDVPAPPHCAASRPPGLSAARSRANSALVVLDPVEGGGREDGVHGLGRAAGRRGRRRRPRSRRRRVSLDHRLRCRRPRSRGRPARARDERGDPAGATAGVEDAFVAAAGRGGRSRRGPSRSAGPRHGRRNWHPIRVAAYVRTLSHTLAADREITRCDRVSR